MKAQSSKTLIKSIIKRLKAAEAEGVIKDLWINVEPGHLAINFEEVEK